VEPLYEEVDRLGRSNIADDPTHGRVLYVKCLGLRPTSKV